MSVAQLYHHASPKSESPLAAKALVRLLRSHVEVQSVVLNAIASISAKRKEMFEPYLKSFFVRTSDPTNIKLLKLEILTNLTTDANVSVILRELQTYISNSDKHFVAATIQAIGRCACSISEVTDSCLNGLVSLLSNRDGKYSVYCLFYSILNYKYAKWSRYYIKYCHNSIYRDNISKTKKIPVMLPLLSPLTL